MSIDSFVAREAGGPFIISAVGLPRERRTSFYLRHTRTMPVDIPTMAVAFSAAKKAGCLVDVRFVLNSGVAVPMRLKKTENVFEGCSAADVKLKDLRTALAADTAGLRLDDHKRACLQNDAEEIVVRLTKSER
jgi:CO/xanthine dehydrogenase FAD-binding subunit